MYFYLWMLLYYTHKGIRACSAPLSLNSVINKSCWVTYLCLFIYGCYCTIVTREYELAKLLSSIHLSLTSRVGSPFYVYLSLDAIVLQSQGYKSWLSSCPHSVINKSCWVTYICLSISGCYCTSHKGMRASSASLLYSSVINSPAPLSFHHFSVGRHLIVNCAVSTTEK
jgi:hypothetical protein